MIAGDERSSAAFVSGFDALVFRTEFKVELVLVIRLLVRFAMFPSR